MQRVYIYAKLSLWEFGIWDDDFIRTKIDEFLCYAGK